MRMHPMNKCLLVLALVALLIGALPVLAQQDLDETYVAKDGTFTFNYPGTWGIDVNDTNVVVYSDEMDVYVYGPAAVESWDWGTSDPVELVQGIADQWADDGYDVGNVKALTLAGRDGAFVNYMEDTTPGMLVGVVLPDGSLAVIDVIGQDGDKDIADRDTVLAIAETVDVVFGGAPATMTLKDYDSGYRDTVAELRDLNLIPSGGTLLFEEDYTWSEGQGAFYTPLARNSPYTNFVMAGELTYHPSGVDDYETCTLVVRVVSSGGSASDYIHVGYANGYGVFFLNNVNGESESSGVSNLDVDITDSHVLTIIGLDKTLTVFVDGELAFEKETVDKHSGTWGVALNGAGPGAKCEARNIWVYTLP